MKTVKQSFLLLMLAIGIPAVVYAAPPEDKCFAYFPTRKGASLEYTVHDIKNGSNKGTIRQTVSDVTNTGNGLKIVVKSERVDQNVRINQKGTYSVSGEIEMRCENGIFYADVRTLLDNKTSMYKAGDKKLSGNDLQLPAEMSAGQSLPDADISIGAETAGLPIPPISISVFNRKVKSVESVTTPAGTFECYKIESEVEMAPVAVSNLIVTQWIARGVGIVQSETYDEDGKLVSKMQLAKLEE